MNRTAQLLYSQADAVVDGTDPAAAITRVYTHVGKLSRLDLDPLAAAQILDGGAVLLRAVNVRYPNAAYQKAADELSSAVEAVVDDAIIPTDVFFGWLNLFVAKEPEAKAGVVPTSSVNDIAAALRAVLSDAITVRVASMPDRVTVRSVQRDGKGLITGATDVETDA